MMTHADLMRRLKNDLADIYSDSDMDGIYVCPDDEDTRKVHTLIVGPDGTPYEKGFFYFIFQYPENYPLTPPQVKLMTTGNGTVRFNPNLYHCGKVCLSILGTWSGPGWTSVMTTKSVLISIRSLMSDKPFYNEPGYEGKETSYESESRAYNERVEHDTLRVAVIDMVANALEMSTDEFSSATTSSNSTATPLSNGSAVPIPASVSNGQVVSSSNSASTTGTKSKTYVMTKSSGRQVRGPFQMPPVLKEMVIRLFHKKFTYYLDFAETRSKRDGEAPKVSRSSFFLEKAMSLVSAPPLFYTLPKGYRFEYGNLRNRLQEIYKRIRIEENLANELYESLRTNYCPVRTVSPEEEEEMTALFNEN